MSQLAKLRKLRQELLDHIGSIEEMRRGSVIRQFFKTKRRELNVPVLIGPYALYTFKKKRKTVGRRLREPEEIRRLEEQASFENQRTPFISLDRGTSVLARPTQQNSDYTSLP